MVLSQRLPDLLPSLLICSLAVSQFLHARSLNKQVNERGAVYTEAQKQNSPFFRTINPLVCASSLCSIISQIISIAFDEGDGVNISMLSGWHHVIFSFFVSTSMSAYICSIIALQFFTVRAFASLFDPTRSAVSFPDSWRFAHLGVAIGTFLLGWITVLIEFGTDNRSYNLLFTYYLALLFATSLCVQFFIFYRAWLNRDMQLEHERSTWSVESFFDRRSAVLPLKLMVLGNVIIEIIILTLQFLIFIRPKSYAASSFDPLIQTNGDQSISQLLLVHFGNAFFLWASWIPMCACISQSDLVRRSGIISCLCCVHDEASIQADGESEDVIADFVAQNGEHVDSSESQHSNQLFGESTYWASAVPDQSYVAMK